MSFKNYLYFIFPIVIFSCTQEKDPLIKSFDSVYQQVLMNDYSNFDSVLDEKSKELYLKLIDPDYLNIDSMISLGNKYKIKCTLVDYLALSENRIKEGSSKSEFYRYLGANDISFFSFMNAYYVDKPKLKKGKENFVAIIKEEMTQSKRTWVNFYGNESKGYKLNLLYTLQLEEPKLKLHFKLWQKASNSELSFDEYIRYYYWQNSGKNSSRFETDMLNLEKSKREGRAETIRSYENRGLKDKTIQSN
ncbi:MAG: hypothetical protein ACJA1A_001006 [Saprospiraceae bacterium]|jgi:hypothetical protein|tara:strand:+ start:3528 stop:4271 length:744 start_codon:yes stop_codon:yes gene_type:complete